MGAVHLMLPFMVASLPHESGKRSCATISSVKPGQPKRYNLSKLLRRHCHSFWHRHKKIAMVMEAWGFLPPSQRLRNSIRMSRLPMVLLAGSANRRDDYHGNQDCRQDRRRTDGAKAEASFFMGLG